MINNKAKVAFISYTLSGGGSEKNIILLKRQLKKIGICADIITFKKVNDYIHEYPETKDVISLTSIDKKIPRLFFPFVFLFSVIKLFLIIKKGKYTILFGVQHYLPYYVSVIFSKIFNIKCVLIIVNNIPRELDKFTWLYKKIHFNFLKKALCYCNSIICKSVGTSIMLQNSFNIQPNKVQIIPNGMDLDRINVKKKSAIPKKYVDIFKNNLVLLSVGRLEHQKNHLSLISLFKEIKNLDENNTIKLCILGKGTLLSTLKALVRQLKLESDVFFLGHESYNLYRYMYRSKLFLLSSRYEGFGNVIIESLACGLPVISTDCNYGPKEILGNMKSYFKNTIHDIQYRDYGILIPPHFEETNIKKKIAKDIYQLLYNKIVLNTYKKASQKRARVYSIEKVGRQYKDLIFNT
jgi:glycosyltransferase involved in cell wall biosynthesis